MKLSEWYDFNKDFLDIDDVAVRVIEPGEHILDLDTTLLDAFAKAEWAAKLFGDYELDRIEVGKENENVLRIVLLVPKNGGDTN